MRPVPGWEEIFQSETESTPRAIHVWTDTIGIDRIGVLCDNNVYVYEGDSLIDITPEDFVGPADDLLVGGYGTDDYNLDTYGSPRPDRERIRGIGPAWSIDNWGEDLVVMSSYDGRLLRWTPNQVGDPPAGVVPDSPTGRFFVVTPERHVIMFGINGDFRRWGWCSQEDIEDWDFADPTNTAGQYDIEPASPLVCGKVGRYGVVFFTTKKAYVARYIGIPYIYSYEEIGADITPISHATMANYPGGVVWPSDNGFWSFDGASTSPIDCPLLDWLKETSNATYIRYRMAAVPIGVQPEIWWFFPSSGTENDKYLCWNYKYQTQWSMGEFGRSCGASSSYNSYPVMSDGESLFLHEKGQFYPGAPLPYAESAALNLKNGARIITLLQGVPDHVSGFDEVVYTFFARFKRVKPYDSHETSKGPLSVREDGYLDIRYTGRDIRMRVATASEGKPPWSFTSMLATFSVRGGR